MNWDTIQLFRDPKQRYNSMDKHKWIKIMCWPSHKQHHVYKQLTITGSNGYNYILDSSLTCRFIWDTEITESTFIKKRGLKYLLNDLRHKNKALEVKECIISTLNPKRLFSQCKLKKKKKNTLKKSPISGLSVICVFSCNRICPLVCTLSRDAVR